MSENQTNREFAAFEQESMETSQARPGAERAEERRPKANRGERGFAAMSPELQKQIARKGGAAVSQNREHMAEIGRKGGETVSKDREHMSSIGRKGGKSGGEHRTEQ